MTADKRKQRGKGKPFVKGDPRINRTNGPLTHEAKAWGASVKNALARKMPPNEYADLLIKYAKLGRPWAILEMGERLMGKEEQPLTGGVTLRFKFGQNGNGDGN